MRVDWEDEIKYDGKKIFVQVEYDLEWNSLETHKITKVKNIQAFSVDEDLDNPTKVKCTEDLQEHIAEIIDDERYNR